MRYIAKRSFSVTAQHLYLRDALHEHHVEGVLCWTDTRAMSFFSI